MTDLSDLVRRYRQLAAARAELEAEMAGITDSIRSSVDIGWSIEVDGIVASVRAGRRKFDLPTAVTLLTPEQREQCKATVFKPELVRELVEQSGLIDEAMIDSGAAPSVVLR